MSLKKIFIYLIAFSAISFNAWSQNKAIVKGLVINQQNQLPISDAQIALLENKVKALVATVALGMGYDKPDISFVIHFQMPGSAASCPGLGPARTARPSLCPRSQPTPARSPQIARPRL